MDNGARSGIVSPRREVLQTHGKQSKRYGSTGGDYVPHRAHRTRIVLGRAHQRRHERGAFSSCPRARHRAARRGARATPRGCTASNPHREDQLRRLRAAGRGPVGRRRRDCRTSIAEQLASRCSSFELSSARLCSALLSSALLGSPRLSSAQIASRSSTTGVSGASHGDLTIDGVRTMLCQRAHCVPSF